MASGIYRITNRINGHSYVGSGVSIEGRWKTHRHRLRNGNHHSIALQRAWDKHGEKAFEFVVVEFVPDRHLLIEREQHWMDALHAYGGGYNAAPKAGSQLGRKWSEEQRARAAGRCTRGPVPEAERAAMRARKLGVPRPKEAREKIRATLIAKDIHPSPEATAKGGRNCRGVSKKRPPFSAAHCAAISRGRAYRFAMARQWFSLIG
jgi:group I intron endonuclease